MIDLIRDRSGLPSPAVNPSRTPKESRQANGGYTPNELARVLRVGPPKIHQWIRRGELEAINVASAKCRKPRYVIMPDALARFEARHKVETPKPAPRRRRQQDVIDYYP